MLKRLQTAERQSIAARKKAEEALKAAEEAQAVAPKKQRYREVNVIPERAIGPRVKNESGGFSDREFYPYLHQSN